MPQKSPGALRAPDCFIFLWLLLLSDPRYPQDFPGALRAPDCCIPLCFCCLFTPNTPKTRRASRAGLLHFPIGSVAFYSKIPLRNPGALRPPDCFISLWFILLFYPKYPGKIRCAWRARLLHSPMALYFLRSLENPSNGLEGFFLRIPLTNFQTCL